MKLESNIWKYFIFQLTQRRNYIPILSIYFLTLPNTLAQQIGLYTGIGFLAGFLLEIPSGYFSDTVGHKKTLILSKALMMLSTICFLAATIVTNPLPLFILGSILISAGFAFMSGSGSAFIHNTLLGLGREKEYSALMGKIKGNVSLLSAILIVFLPAFTSVSIIFPLQIWLAMDV